MKSEDYAVLSNETLDRLLFSVVGMIDKNGIMKLVADDEKYAKFQRLLLDLRMAVRQVMANKQEEITF